MMKALQIYPLTAERWSDLVELFGSTGADGGCWCMYWRFTSKEYTRSTRQRNKIALRQRVEAAEATGLLAYYAQQPVGWCGISPRENFARLQHSRHFRPLDDKPTWSIVCFFIERQYRRQHIATSLLRAAVNYAFEHGAQVIESYPIQMWTETVTVQAAFPGTVAWFHAVGFREVMQTEARSGGQQRVIMRLER
ncbi:MAG TPA: GNAT family N-acetyltransferase [Lacipirellulaceae bacterium]